MVNIILSTFFVALASATRLPRHADDMDVNPTTQAGAAAPSEAVKWVYVTATDYITVYPTASQAPAPTPPGSVPIVESKKPSAIPSFALSSSLIPYGSGLPGPSPLSSATIVVSKAPEASTTACNKASSSMAGPPTQLPASLTLVPHGFPGYKPAPASCAAPVAPLSSATPSALTPTPTPTSMAATSTAIVIVPTSLPVVLARSFNWSKDSLSIAVDKRQDDESESSSTRTTTIKTTIVTSRLPSSTLRVSRSSAKSAASTTNAKTMSKSALSSTAKPSKTDSATVVTSVVVGDGRCPYPYPGVHCGGPETTLVTKTKSSQSTSTKKQEPKASASAGDWCPYPGQKC
ncbi:hypothetical protein HBI56_036340 [Parastagonospora nodorum]|nr:hypothetical protein HBH53_016710 [Parastagonospora nodorum]KAH4040613.1 hypothetical protein HBI09_030210 [Parastagonospora nodorum]KAH4071069.1 hypothetical protein HBH50_076070 [Parastagonospora nodorum]KAH4093766.1 hypothetical protein HBH48_064320 [Parastagonospora nodorum]KAH4114169.1 hypothetical protein HBH47_198760 [Parastagonospora nodorum]